MKMSVTRIFTFEASHYLPNYNGPCGNMHGHSYILHATYTGPVHADGMVLDFGDIKTYMNLTIDKLDHRCLNDLIEVPTAENILWYIFNDQQGYEPHPTRLVLYETAKCYATLEV